MDSGFGVRTLDAACTGVPGDSHLAVRIRQGDPVAEAELVIRYRDGLRMMLGRHVKDVTRAEDLCHEVFGIALPALRQGRLRDEAKLTGYLWGIARKLASRDCRLRLREQNPAPGDTAVDPSPGADERCAQSERAALLRSALDDLSARDRDVLRAFYLAGMPKTAICRCHGFTPAQFDVIKHRALKRLAVAFHAQGGDRA